MTMKMNIPEEVGASELFRTHHKELRAASLNIIRWSMRAWPQDTHADFADELLSMCALHMLEQPEGRIAHAAKYALTWMRSQANWADGSSKTFSAYKRLCQQPKAPASSKEPRCEQPYLSLTVEERWLNRFNCDENQLMDVVALRTAKLTATERECFTLRFAEEMTVVKIMAHTGLTRKAINENIISAMDKVRSRREDI